MIRSPMSFTAPEGHFHESLHENGQPYQNFSELALGLVRYQHCICDLQQKLQRNSRYRTNIRLVLDKSKSQMTPILVRLAFFRYTFEETAFLSSEVHQ